MRDGRFKQYSRLSLSLDGAYVGDRASGRLAANGAGARLNADFDVPVKELRGGCHHCPPIHVTAHVDELRMEDLRQALGIDPWVSGVARADLKVSGTAGTPVLELAIDGRAIR